MKKLFVIVFCLIGFVGCKNDSKSGEIDATNTSYDQNDGLVTMRGEFIYYADAAVLQTPNEIYGVVIDEMMHKLHDQAKPYQKEATDMVPVTVRVKRFEKDPKEEGWQYKVEIKEILKIEAPDPNRDDVIKLEN